MSHIAQKRPFASLVDDDPIETTPPPSPPQTQPAVLMNPAEKKWCAQTIKSLKKHKRAIAFLDPVDPIQFNIPDYFDIIKSPMDLGTVEKKLAAEAYPTVEAFKADIQLVFNNCYLYNNAGDPVTQDAKKLEEHYMKLCKKEPSVMVTNTASKEPKAISSTTHQSTVAIEPPNTIQQPLIQSISNETPSTITLPAQVSPTPMEELTQPTEDIVKHKYMPEDQFKRCEALVKELKKSKNAAVSWPFANPVDAAAWGASDYYDIIKQPMDMTTYEKKLYESQYSHENELLDDIRLMLRNCYTYNPPDHLVHGLGKQFEQLFEKIWAKICQRSHQKGDSSKKSSKHSTKRQRMSDTVNTTNVQPPTVIERKADIPTNINNHHTNNQNNTTTVNQNNGAPNSGRSTILRLKLNVSKPKEPEPEPEAPKPKPVSKPIVKIPGLALSKEPPSASNGLKLAIGKPISPIKEKKPEKHTPTVLKNHDQWLAIAKNDTPTQPKPHSHIHNTNHIPNRKPKELISPVTHTTAPPKPKEPVVPAAKSFDINDLYNQIHNERKLKEQQKQEEQEKWERNERIRLEKERIASEERLNKLREFNQHLQVKRQQDKEERIRQLNMNKIDISKQKMKFNKFEMNYMARDQDWREIYIWQRDTIDYRHIPVPGFVKRAPIKLNELRKRLLSKCVRLENSKTNHNAHHSPDGNQEDDGGSDMDVE